MRKVKLITFALYSCLRISIGRQVLLFALCSLLFGICEAQQSMTWQRLYGLQNEIEYATSVAQTPDNGYIAVGRKRYQSNNYMYILRTDEHGDTLWTKVYPGLIFLQIQRTSDDNYIITGSSLVLLKIDVNGNTLWSRPPYSSSKRLNAIKETTDKGFILAGENLNGNKPYILKVDSVGNFIWEKTYANFSIGVLSDIVRTSDKGYASCGFEAINGAFIIKTDSSGNMVWFQNYDSISYANSILLLPDGGYILGGGNRVNQSSPNPLIFRTDQNGNQIWSRAYYTEGRGFAICYQLIKTSDGGYIMTGGRDTTGITPPTFFVHILKTDSLGIEEWNRIYGFNDNDNGYSIREANDSGYIIAGINGSDFADVYLIKTDKNGYADPTIGIDPLTKEVPEQFYLFQNYPNPFNQTTNIEFSLSQRSFVILDIYDTQGRRINRLKEGVLNRGNYRFAFNGQDLSSGIYFYSIFVQNILKDISSYRKTRKMVLLK